MGTSNVKYFVATACVELLLAGNVIYGGLGHLLIMTMLSKTDISSCNLTDQILVQNAL